MDAGEARLSERRQIAFEYGSKRSPLLSFFSAASVCGTGSIDSSGCGSNGSRGCANAESRLALRLTAETAAR